MKATFGFDSFRPLQEGIVTTILGGQDVFVLMPTGGGKSLCYQLPALLQDGMAVVVSPLVALMKDQVDSLTALGVPASYINSLLEPDEIRRRQALVARGAVKILYVAPERLATPGFMRLLANQTISYFAIDEAHCISEWGHDFRPAYRDLRKLREAFPGTPLGAFTATATRRVQADIKDQLGLQNAASFQGSYNRPNLYYEVRPKQNTYAQLVAYLRGLDRVAGIIYCQSRASTESLAAKLRADGFNAAAYHAGLEAEERKSRQEDFKRDDLQIVVATIAFGMGIDKPDVRFVVHYDLPRSLEGFYQESGRAGRDGEPSECILFYSYADVVKQTYFVEQKTEAAERQRARQQLRQMADWASGSDCRRQSLLAYFDERFTGQEGRCCDICTAPQEESDYTIAAQQYLSCAKRTGERFGSVHLVNILRGSRAQQVLRLGHDRLTTYGIGRERSQEEWQQLAQALLRGGYARQAGERFNAVEVTELGHAVLFRGERVLLALPSGRTPVAAAPRADKGEQPSLASMVAPERAAGPLSQALFEQLRTLRKRLADERGVPPYVIFHDTTLREMATALPTTRAGLLRIRGVGERKAADFGDAFLGSIQSYRQTSDS
ncbi:MAG: DNA helicase RecQ [Chloroflexota bacterium]